MSETNPVLKIYDTPQRKRVEFEPYNKGKVRMYSCGPTVYNTVHIGNLRSIVNFDVVGRALRYLGYDVKRVVNFTDVGHMSSDADFGEDKIEKKAKEENVGATDIANKYIFHVVESFRKLNVLNPNGTEIKLNIDVKDTTKEEWAELGWARATDYILEMIELISLIEKNGHTYETEQALYFDISTYPQYFEFTGQKLEEKQVAVREEVKGDPSKRHPADFVLWMKRFGKYENHMMHWNSPWGDGFPGWHIECSAMSWKLLGDEIDIHTGGSDLVSLHHPNEIAQNFGAFGHDIVKYWLHNAFVFTTDGEKLSKSKGNALSLKEIEQRGINLMALRWYYLTSSYRAPMNFSMKSLESSQKAYFNIINVLKKLDNGKIGAADEKYITLFKEALADNFNTPKVLALLNTLMKADLNPEDIIATAFEFDRVLGLDLEKASKEKKDESHEIPSQEVEDIEIREILNSRQKAREEKDWSLSDQLRDELFEKGYQVLDREDGQYISKV